MTARSDRHLIGVKHDLGDQNLLQGERAGDFSPYADDARMGAIADPSSLSSNVRKPVIENGRYEQ